MREYNSKILFVLILILALYFLFFLKNPYAVLGKEYGVSQKYIRDNLIYIEEVNDKQSMYFIKSGNNEVLQALVFESPFGYKVQSIFRVNTKDDESEWYISNGKFYNYSLLDYSFRNSYLKSEKYGWTINGVLYDNDIKNVVINGEDSKIIELQLEDEKIRYFYYIHPAYPEKLRGDELPQDSNDIPIDFIY